MNNHRRVSLLTGLLWVAMASTQAQAQAQGQTPSADDAALGLLPTEQEAPPPATQRGLRLFGELAVGRMSQRYGLPSEDTRRASIDLTWEFKPAPQWRAVLSDRLDDAHPVDEGSRSTLNSLREAFVGWQSDDGQLGMELGRVNVRYGPAYGFNPTDFFRDGSNRAVTSADPLAQRENRLGTVMVRAQRLWAGGSFSLALAPKLKDGPSSEPFSLDLGATNHSDRVLLAYGAQPAEGYSVKAFAFHEKGRGLQLGASGTALLGEAAVGFIEWSGGRGADLFSETFDVSPKIVTRHRATMGMTYTTASRLALTAEFEYNGFALNRSQWDQALATTGLEALGAYQVQVQRRQDIASRRAVLVYVSQRDAFVKNLDLTGLVRYNVEDRSRFAWAEARYHWPKLDLALQWQASLGNATSEYGAQPAKQLLQLMAAFYF
jgi:hypothetical protein